MRMQVPLDELPEIGDPDGRDDAELIWAPLDDDDEEEEAGEEADEDRAAFLRKWASLDYEHESLMSLYHAGNDAERAEEAMATLAAEAPSQRTLGQEAGLGALMSAEIIEHRKDLYRAQKSIVKKVSASARGKGASSMPLPAQPTADPQFLFLSCAGPRDQPQPAPALLLFPMAHLVGGDMAVRGDGAGGRDGGRAR